MNLELKDLVYLGTYFITILSVFFTIRNQIRDQGKDIKRIMDTLYGDKGSLNVVDVKTCKSQRDDVFNAIRRGESLANETSRRIESLNDNIIAIMVTLQIKPLKRLEFIGGLEDDKDN